MLFGAVQITMIGYGLYTGERLNMRQVVGLAIAICGLVGLLLPGMAAPPLTGSLLMLIAGIAWGVYSLRGRGAGDAIQKTAGNFVRAVPVAVIVSLIFMSQYSVNWPGLLLAIASGAVASGVGYAIWYTTLPELNATTAAIVQLSVPVLTALGGVALLSELLTMRLVMASVAILGGIALFVLSRQNNSGKKANGSTQPVE
jgi:drug/metabolite transporter (DMT)-like permease